MKNIFISGITGKVGKLLTDKILNDNFFHLTGGSCNENNNFLGSDVGDLVNQENLNIFITKDIPSKAEIDIIIDFSSPHASNLALQEALNRKIPILIGTTGLNEEQLKEIDSASQDIPILLAPNTSTGVAVLKSIINSSSNLFSEEHSFYLKETHHTEKKDSPSGTAIDLQNHIKKIFPSSDIAIESFREGTNPGEHTIRINFEGEHIELTHRAEDRSIFAIGAIRGAKWLFSKPIGLYHMEDIYSS